MNLRIAYALNDQNTPFILSHTPLRYPIVSRFPTLASSPGAPDGLVSVLPRPLRRAATPPIGTPAVREQRHPQTRCLVPLDISQLPFAS